MTITRTLALVAGGLMTALAVVVIRAEAARLNYQLSQLDAREVGLRLQIHESELEIARLKSPGAVRAKLAAMHVLDGGASSAAGTPERSERARQVGSGRTGQTKATGERREASPRKTPPGRTSGGGARGGRTP